MSARLRLHVEERQGDDRMHQQGPGLHSAGNRTLHSSARPPRQQHPDAAQRRLPDDGHHQLAAGLLLVLQDQRGRAEGLPEADQPGGAGPVGERDEGDPDRGLEELQGPDEAQPVWKPDQAGP